MRLYLSSFRIGDRADELVELVAGRPIGFVPNAMDHVPSAARAASNARSVVDLTALGIAAVELDLRQYFNDAHGLVRALDSVGGVWVRGGNTFVLRQAMRLSGFDTLLQARLATDFLYGGYSAGVCVLAPRLDGLQHVDDPSARPYPNSDVIWEGVGLLDYLILPHYQSDHPESAAVELDVAYCRAHNIAFHPLRDGEVVVTEIGPLRQTS
jgi:dipeptidase E